MTNLGRVTGHTPLSRCYLPHTPLHRRRGPGCYTGEYGSSVPHHTIHYTVPSQTTRKTSHPLQQKHISRHGTARHIHKLTTQGGGTFNLNSIHFLHEFRPLVLFHHSSLDIIEIYSCIAYTCIHVYLLQAWD